MLSNTDTWYQLKFNKILFYQRSAPSPADYLDFVCKEFFLLDFLDNVYMSR